MNSPQSDGEHPVAQVLEDSAAADRAKLSEVRSNDHHRFLRELGNRNEHLPRDVVLDLRALVNEE